MSTVAPGVGAAYGFIYILEQEIRLDKEESLALQGAQLDEVSRGKRHVEDKLVGQERAHTATAEQLERLFEARRQKDTERIKARNARQCAAPRGL